MEVRRHCGVGNAGTRGAPFRWRPLLAILASIVVLGSIFRLWSICTAENVRAERADPDSVDDPAEHELPHAGTIQVTVDGRDVNPSEQRAFQSFAQQVLSEAIASLVNQSAEQFAEQLSLEDDTEADLILNELPSDEGSVACVYLVKPGDPAVRPKSITLTSDGRTVVKFIRMFASVDRPLAILTETKVVDGSPFITERMLVYDSTSGWQELDQTTETREWDLQVEQDNGARSAQSGTPAQSP